MLIRYMWRWELRHISGWVGISVFSSHYWLRNVTQLLTACVKTFLSDVEVKEILKKFWGSNGIRTHDLRDTGVMLYFNISLSYTLHIIRCLCDHVCFLFELPIFIPLRTVSATLPNSITVSPQLPWWNKRPSWPLNTWLIRMKPKHRTTREGRGKEFHFVLRSYLVSSSWRELVKWFLHILRKMYNVLELWFVKSRVIEQRPLLWLTK